MPILERNDLGPIAHLTMNSPEPLNVLSDEMVLALQTEFDSLSVDQSIRVVILSGSGRAFCVGHNLKQMTKCRESEDGGYGHFVDHFQRCANMMMTIQSMPQPVIAKVHGVATAAGCQLVASCDLAVAEEGTRFGVNGVNIGLFCSTPMVALSRSIPRKQAFEMLTTGDFISAERAAEIGLINRVVPDTMLEQETLSLAEQLSGKLGTALKVGKQAFYKQLQMPLDKAYVYSGEVMAQNMMNPDTEEGISAFIQKRPPDWHQ